MNQPDIKYRQAIDEKTGEIKYIPDTPPQQPPEQNQEEEGNSKSAQRVMNEVKNDFDKAVRAHDKGEGNFFDLKDERLSKILEQLEKNNKKLRYDRRLQLGKLDGRRLTAYKTSDRLFKKKAIKHNDYQFTILLDTSGSMFGNGDNEWVPEESKIRVAVESIVRITRALEEVNIPVAIIGMNNETRLVKSFDEEFDFKTVIDRLRLNMCGQTSDEDESDTVNCAGTSEMVAYQRAVEYMHANSKTKKTKNVAFVISDGEPNICWDETPAYMNVKDDDDCKRYESNPGGVSGDNHENLRAFWNRHQDISVYGFGIKSDARQVPRSKRIEDTKILPEVMSNIVQSIML